jgi:hypothetical protein
MCMLGFFVDYIDYLIIISTALEVIVVGLSTDKDNIRGPTKMYSTQFTLPSDNVSMIHIVGLQNGRILTCGSDGHIYELCYGVSNVDRKMIES